MRITLVILMLPLLTILGEEPAEFPKEPASSLADPIGSRYHRETMIRRSQEALHPLERKMGQPIPLPGPRSQELSVPLGSVLARRRSRRDQVDQPITLQQLSDLLWATQGVTRPTGGRTLFRTAPSAGAAHPLDTFVVAGRVTGLPSGLYRLEVDRFRLIPLASGDLRPSLTDACLGQDFIRRSAVSLVWAAVPDRTTRRYEQRGWRYIYMDAGHLAQNLYLAAEAMGLSCCTVGAFQDDALNALLGLDGRESTAIYLGAVGPGAPR